MTSDRELLELAAKAYWADELEDMSIRYDAGEGGICYIHADNQDHNGHDREFLWNPLDEDGDAMRLAVKLGMHIIMDSILGVIGEKHHAAGKEAWAYEKAYDSDPNTATRRAIVRAAAGIGRSEG